MITAGADVNIRNELTLPPLISFVETESEDLVKDLLNAGAEANSIDEYGNTALMKAVQTANKQQSPVQLNINYHY